MAARDGPFTLDPDSLIAIQPGRFAELEILELVAGSHEQYNV